MNHYQPKYQDSSWAVINRMVKKEAEARKHDLECRYCGRYFEFDQEPTESERVDFGEHETYCNPAHQRSVAGERF